MLIISNGWREPSCSRHGEIGVALSTTSPANEMGELNVEGGWLVQRAAVPPGAAPAHVAELSIVIY